MNGLYVGLTAKIVQPAGGFLYIDDEVPSRPRSRVFDPTLHSFNPLKGIEYKAARELVTNILTAYPFGTATLTYERKQDQLLDAFTTTKKHKTLRNISVGQDAKITLDNLLRSPVLNRVLCEPTNFSFNKNTKIYARLNRAELGDFDAFVIGQFLIAQFQGQIILPDARFYLKDSHISLVREKRLIASVIKLDHLPPLIKDTLLLGDVYAATTTAPDAHEIAQYQTHFRPSQNGYNDFIADCIA